MGWDTQYALEGLFQFGAPLNVTHYVIDPDDNRFGQSTDTYWVARFLLDEETSVIARLDGLLRGPLIYYPLLHLLRRTSASYGPPWVTERRFSKAWLFSYGGTFTNPRSPAVSLRGQALGVAFNKADNRHIRASH